MPNILIVGGTRGLVRSSFQHPEQHLIDHVQGSALVEHYTKEASNTVYATSRSPEPPLKHIGSNVKWLTGIDLMKPTCGKDLATQIPNVQVSLLVISAGVFIRESFDDPGPSWEDELKMYTTSAIAPPFIISEIAKSNLLRKGAKVILVSSEAGSLKLRVEGGGDYAHHASKAAMNMVGKQLSFDLQPLGIALALVHPSFLRSDMTKK